MNQQLLELIQRESRCHSGFAWVPLDELWADIALMRTWDTCKDLPATCRELRAQVRALGKAVVIDGERVKAVAGVEVVPADCLFAK